MHSTRTFNPSGGEGSRNPNLHFLGVLAMHFLACSLTLQDKRYPTPSESYLPARQHLTGWLASLIHPILLTLDLCCYCSGYAQMPWLPSDKSHQAGEGWPLTHKRADLWPRGFLASTPGLRDQCGAREDL